jgi:hypothetical protein
VVTVRGQCPFRRPVLALARADRTVCVTPLDGARPREAHVPSQRLHLILRCQNVPFEGVRTEKEQAKLRQHSTR